MTSQSSLTDIDSNEPNRTDGLVHLLDYEGDELCDAIHDENADLLAGLVQDNHHIHYTRNVTEYRSLRINDGEVSEKDEGISKIEQEGVDGFTCECGDEFTSKNDVEAHLHVISKVRSAGVFLEDENPLTFEDDTTNISFGVTDYTNEALPDDFEGVEMMIRANEEGWLGSQTVAGNTVAKVADDLEVVSKYVNAYGRRVLPLPENYRFFDWTLDITDEDPTPPSTDERDMETVFYTEVDNGAIRCSGLDRKKVEVALRVLTEGESYDADAYVLYDCGPLPAVLEAPDGEAMVVAGTTT